MLHRLNAAFNCVPFHRKVNRILENEYALWKELIFHFRIGSDECMWLQHAEHVEHVMHTRMRNTHANILYETISYDIWR